MEVSGSTTLGREQSSLTIQPIMMIVRYCEYVIVFHVVFIFCTRSAFISTAYGIACTISNGHFKSFCWMGDPVIDTAGNIIISLPAMEDWPDTLHLQVLRHLGSPQEAGLSLLAARHLVRSIFCEESTKRIRIKNESVCCMLYLVQNPTNRFQMFLFRKHTGFLEQNFEILIAVRFGDIYPMAAFVAPADL